MAEEQFSLPSDLAGLLILAEDDEVLDYRVARDAAGESRMVILPHGWHQLHNTADYRAAAAAFLRSTLANRSQ